MSEGVWIAIIGLIGLCAGGVIGGYFANKSLKATLRNNLDLAMVPFLQQQAELKAKQKETHDLVNSRMTELLELTRKSSEAKGKLEGQSEGGVVSDSANKTTLTADVKEVKQDVVEVKKEVKEVKEEVEGVKREISIDNKTE